MSFLNPWGLLANLFLVPVVLLYLLKRQHEDRTVSSILLWREVRKDLQATRPWQRLRTRLLLILQILAILLFSLSLARPVFTGGEGGVHTIAVVDTSARMQATDVKPSRIGRAREDLLRLIQGMGQKDTMTIIQAGIQPFVSVGPTGEKGTLREYAGEIYGTNGRSDLGRAVQLAQTLLQDTENGTGEIHVFSDKPVEGGEALISHVYSGNGQNAAVTNVSYDIRDGRVTALSRVANYGDDRNLTLELKVDGALNNIKEAFLPAGEETNVYWTDIPASAHTIEVSLSEKDDLLPDNRGLAVLNEEYHVKALMVAQRNVFLERAVSLRSDIELIKADPGQTPKSDDYQLYLFDGSLPDTLPEKGHMILFHPPSNKELGISAIGETVPSGVAVNPQTIYPTLIEYIEPQGYQIAKAEKMNVPEGFNVLLADQAGDPMLIAGESEGRKIAVFSFSLHQSNLPLKTDFPILIQNLLRWMLPPDMDFPETVYAGETLQLSPFPDVSEITVTSPSKKEYHLDAYPAPVFYDTYEPGIYEVTQKAGEQTYRGRFVVSVPTSEVSDLRAEAESLSPQPEQAARAVSPFRREIWKIAGWILLMLLLTEWWVYHRDI